MFNRRNGNGKREIGGKDTGQLNPKEMWVISRGQHVDLDLSRIGQELNTETVLEYKISGLARYLLSPHPIKVDRKLVGCLLRYVQPADTIRNRLKRMMARVLPIFRQAEVLSEEMLMAQYGNDPVLLEDEKLKAHCDKIHELLKPYNHVIRKLTKLDRQKIVDVTGKCRDSAGNISNLTLHGNVDEQIAYVINYILKDVDVILNQAYMADGLFEMKGFDFATFDYTHAYRMIKFRHAGTSKACVLDCNNKIEYWIENTKLIHYMQLLEQLIKADVRFNDSLNLCTAGKAEPLKLLFKRPDIEYSESHLPLIYKNVFKQHNVDRVQRNIVANALNHLQLGISFHYVPQDDRGERQLCTSLAVMHNLRALEPIKADLPQLYAVINEMSAVTDAGSFYLLDSFKGYQSGK